MVLAESTHLEQMLWGQQGFAGLPQHTLPDSHEQRLLMETMLALPYSRTKAAITAWMSQAHLVSITTLCSVSFPAFVLCTTQRRGQPVRRFKQQSFNRQRCCDETNPV